MTISRLTWGLVSRFIKLGEQAERLANDTRGIAEQVDVSHAFLLNHKAKLELRLIERLDKACQK